MANDEFLRFVDIWNHFNDHIESLCKKRKRSIMKISDLSNQKVDEEDIALVLESSFDNLELRIKNGDARWPDFSFLSIQRGEELKPITKEKFHDILKQYLKNQSLLDRFESYLPKVAILKSPNIVDKKQTQLPFVKKLPPIEEKEEDNENQDDENENEAEEAKEDQEDIPVKKTRRKRGKSEEDPNDEGIESQTNKKQNVKKPDHNEKQNTKESKNKSKTRRRITKQTSKKAVQTEQETESEAESEDSNNKRVTSNQKAQETRCGLYLYWHRKTNEPCCDPVIMRKNIDDEGFAKWFTLDKKTDKLKIDDSYDPEKLKMTNFATEGPIKDEVPDTMITFFVRNHFVRDAFQNDRTAIYQKMSPWLTKPQLTKWKQWSTKNWESEYLNLFHK